MVGQQRLCALPRRSPSTGTSTARSSSRPWPTWITSWSGSPWRPSRGARVQTFKCFKRPPVPAPRPDRALPPITRSPIALRLQVPAAGPRLPPGRDGRRPQALAAGGDGEEAGRQELCVHQRRHLHGQRGGGGDAGGRRWPAAAARAAGPASLPCSPQLRWQAAAQEQESLCGGKACPAPRQPPPPRSCRPPPTGCPSPAVPLRAQVIAQLVPEHLKRCPNAKMFLRSFWYRATLRQVVHADEMHIYTLARCSGGGRAGGALVPLAAAHTLSCAACCWLYMSGRGLRQHATAGP